MYRIKAAGETRAELLIYGDIGESWWGESVEAKTVVEQLSDLEVDVLDVRINSYGGSVSDGVAIYNAIRRMAAKGVEVNVHIDGVAISIASLIAMAGNTVYMAANARFMVHAPWGGVAGNAAELREYADMLDGYAESMSSSYERKTGKARDEILPLLMDGKDHWYGADQAVAFGFVDEITDALDVAASLDWSHIENRFNPPAAVAATLKPMEALPMTVKKTTAPATNTDAAGATTEPVNTQTPAAPDNQVRTEQEVLSAETQRRTTIRAAFQSFLAREGVQALLDACLDDHTVNADQARNKLLAKLGEGSEPAAGGIITLGDDGARFRSGAMQALMARAGLRNSDGKPLDLQGNPYRSMTLLEMARASLSAAGVNATGMDKMSLVAAAFQTTSDFPVLLENVIHKTLQQAYLTAADTWSRFCKIGSVSDFRAHNRYRVGSIGNLDGLGEHGEFKQKLIPDGEKGSIIAGTKGNIIAITRQAIINDDLQALTDLARMLGRAYKRTIEASVYSLLAENSGLGPTLTDGKTLFHADHGNLIASGSGAAPTMASFEAMRVKMASQKDVGGKDYLDLRPDIWLGPIGLGGEARSVNDAQYDPDTANKLQKPNIVRGLVSDVVDTPRLSGTAHYMLADPNDAPVIEVAFLDGMQEPDIETKDGWNVDGAELRVRGDFGVAAIDYRGAVRNHGA